MGKILSGKIRMLWIAMILAVLSFGFVSCSEEPEEEKERLILIYAVVSSDLSSWFGLDKTEIEEVAPALDLEHNAVMVYYATPGGESRLEKLTRNKDGSIRFELERSYETLPLSTSKERISEVLNYVAENYDYQRKGLIFWGHGTGWVEWPQGGNLESPLTDAQSDEPADSRRKAYGAQNHKGKTYRTNIPELAEAIPAGKYDFIWFDCCYMASIENIYQLRHKSPYVVGYVMEVYNPGAPYNLILPYLLRRDADLVGAANEFFEYYYSGVSGYAPHVSVSVIKTSGLDRLAEAAAGIYFDGQPPVSFGHIQNYSRYVQKENGNNGYNVSFPFYDLGQLLGSYGTPASSYGVELQEALDETVVFKKISTTDFSGKIIDVEAYSGLSVCNYDPGNIYAEFYRELDWYKATR